MEKDRTRLLETHRDPIDQSDLDLEQGIATPQWMPQIECIRSTIIKIGTQIEELRILQQSELLDPFTTTDTATDIKQLTNSIIKLFQLAHVELKKVQSGQSQEQRMMQNIKTQLSSELSSLSISFKASQQYYLNKKRGYTTSYNLVTPKNTTVDEIQEGDQQMQVNTWFTRNELIEVDSRTRQIVENSKEIREIVQSIQELSDIMNDFALLVTSQGEILERIDYNVENTVERVEEGVIELEEAENDIKNGCVPNCWKWVIWTLVAIICAELLGIILKVVITRA